MKLEKKILLRKSLKFKILLVKVDELLVVAKIFDLRTNRYWPKFASSLVINSLRVSHDISSAMVFILVYHVGLEGFELFTHIST